MTRQRILRHPTPIGHPARGGRLLPRPGRARVPGNGCPRPHPESARPSPGTTIMNETPDRLSRRDFLAAAGLSTYSVLVLADGSVEAAAPTRAPSEIRDAFRAIAPMDAELAARRFEGE